MKSQLSLTTSKTFKHNFKNDLISSAKQVNENGTRFYEADGAKYPSITTMLGYFTSQSIQQWRNRVGHEEANKISSKAATRGTKFHKVCEAYLLNEQPVFKTPLEQQLFINTREYIDLIDDIHLLEKSMFSHHLRLAGTVDCVARYNDRLSVIDFKTATRSKSKDHIDNYFMQASAYAIMFEEQTRIPVPQIVIIIAVEGEPSQVFVERRDSYAKQLLECRDIYEEKNGWNKNSNRSGSLRSL
jgi:genome maintenance exonuclease 1